MPDRIRIATIGAGGMGSGDTTSAVSLPGVELAGVCDLYTGRLARAKERWGNQIFTTRDYREVLARKDVDAVIIATPDHWHAQITQDALAAGKDVYCEKPMVQKIEQGQAVVAATKQHGERILQVGSQYVSSLVYIKARDLLNAGAIGELNMVEAYLDRNSAIGAWQYSIPPDASEQTVDWDRFLGALPKRPFEATRFFRWRNYEDYGTGVAGDLFVHLLSGLHFATNSLGPTRIYATGGIRYWHDGRDVPDVMLALMDYPKFTLELRVNLKAGLPAENFGFRFVGTEGVMTTSYNSVTLAKTPRETEPGYTIDTFAEAQQKEFLRNYHRQYPQQRPIADTMRPESEKVFTAPRGFDAHLDHHKNFFAAVRSRKQVVEDAVFGLRAAGPALLTNKSCKEGVACNWDPERMEAET
jgi:predicted dehydrogenase